MGFPRPATVLLPFLIASTAFAQQATTPPPHHVVAAPKAPVREAPHARTPAKPTHKATTKTASAHDKHGGKPAAGPPTQQVVPATTEATKPSRPAPPPPDPHKGTVTGLPLPRFVSLRADEVNFRAGPGTRYPVEWLYKRRGLPVEIEREFDVWRLVVAPDGTKGWVHEATLMGRRDFIVIGTERTLRSSPEATARAVALLKPGVVGRLLACPAGSDWCRVQVGTYRGWLQREGVWGVLPGEAIGTG